MGSGGGGGDWGLSAPSYVLGGLLLGRMRCCDRSGGGVVWDRAVSLGSLALGGSVCWKWTPGFILDASLGRVGVRRCGLGDLRMRTMAREAREKRTGAPTFSHGVSRGHRSIGVCGRGGSGWLLQSRGNRKCMGAPVPTARSAIQRHTTFLVSATAPRAAVFAPSSSGPSRAAWMGVGHVSSSSAATAPGRTRWTF